MLRSFPWTLPLLAYLTGVSDPEGGATAGHDLIFPWDGGW